MSNAAATPDRPASSAPTRAPARPPDPDPPSSAPSDRCPQPPRALVQQRRQRRVPAPQRLHHRLPRHADHAAHHSRHRAISDRLFCRAIFTLAVMDTDPDALQDVLPRWAAPRLAAAGDAPALAADGARPSVPGASAAPTGTPAPTPTSRRNCTSRCADARPSTPSRRRAENARLPAAPVAVNAPGTSAHARRPVPSARPAAASIGGAPCPPRQPNGTASRR